MHFLLLHSPLVTSETWITLVPSLEEAGCEATVVAFENRAAQDRTFFEHHVSQIDSALSAFNDQKVVAVAHSGAGNLLALLDPSRIAAYVFFDAIFPLAESTRFALFDDPAVAQSWKNLANHHEGMIPRTTLVRFAEQVTDRRVRNAFVAGISDVPIGLYEESVPVHPDWPPSGRGLYVQWTDAYAADAERAKKGGFEVQLDSASHFEMLNRPDEVARTLLGFARTID